ncbi:MAG: lipoprotein [Clostridia bacterium]|nr:lipoprotein [Clostridia bacterium]MBQ8339281.1 lipoprotein [Clostridia bacterium]
MKRIWAIVLLALLMLSGCQRAKAADITPEELANRLTRSLQDEMPFTAADPDYVESNFPGLDASGLVYFGNDDDICEFGIFQLKEFSPEEAKDIIHAYIKTELEALESMAALYPSEELQERLSCYRNAHVSVGGGYAYYFIMEADEMATARATVRRALG